LNAIDLDRVLAAERLETERVAWAEDDALIGHDANNARTSRESATVLVFPDATTCKWCGWRQAAATKLFASSAARAYCGAL